MDYNKTEHWILIENNMQLDLKNVFEIIHQYITSFKIIYKLL